MLLSDVTIHLYISMAVFSAVLNRKDRVLCKVVSPSLLQKLEGDSSEQTGLHLQILKGLSGSSEGCLPKEALDAAARVMAPDSKVPDEARCSSSQKCSKLGLNCHQPIQSLCLIYVARV